MFFREYAQLVPRVIMATRIPCMLMCSACCGPTVNEAVAEPLCRPQPELEDTLDPDTGLAPIPRHIGDSAPSGPIYWRQMLPHSIAGTDGAEKVFVANEDACALKHDGEATCWSLPHDRFKYLPELRAACFDGNCVPPETVVRIAGFTLLGGQPCSRASVSKVRAWLPALRHSTKRVQRLPGVLWALGAEEDAQGRRRTRKIRPSRRCASRYMLHCAL